MAVLVESCEKTKSGKAWRVRASGQYYNAFLDSGIENYVGKYIEAEIHTHEKYGSSIAAFKPVTPPNAAPQVARSAEREGKPAYPRQFSGDSPAVAAPYHREPTYAEPAKPGTVAPYWLPMASNVVAHAIAAGKIETPAAIKTWVQAVKNAVENVDDIPF